MQVINGGVDAYNAMLYGQQIHANQGFFQQQLLKLPTLGLVGGIGDRFAALTTQAYERWNGSQAKQLAIAALRNVKSLVQDESVRSLFDMADFQTASLTMQRWIMANPVVRQAYQDQRCDGYADTYLDRDEGKIGEAHYDWRRVNDGVVKFDDDDNWYSKEYIEPLRKGDRALLPNEKADILTTWRMAELFFGKNQKDPTSPYDADL